MNIGVILARPGNQASVVEDSVNCFLQYGNFKYQFIHLVNGEIPIDLNFFDAIIIHYSCIAFPYKYQLPITPLSSLKISEYQGIKLAFVQDEQRSAKERFNYLKVLNIHHLFSVAPPELHNILYPENMRGFTVSTVLTGYLSSQHIQIAKENIPLASRPLDLVYRGRSLPEWLGNTGTIKGRIPEIISNQLNELDMKYQIDVSKDENQRLYGKNWFRFLQKGRVSIGSQSGSDYIDFEGKYVESWVPSSTSNDSLNDPTLLNYHVISPRYFDYVASGVVVGLMPGSYSEIPRANDYFQLSSNLDNVPELLEFAKSSEAQKMVDRAKVNIFSDTGLTYAFLVSTVENRIVELVNSLKFVERGNNLKPAPRDPINLRRKFSYTETLRLNLIRILSRLPIIYKLAISFIKPLKIAFANVKIILISSLIHLPNYNIFDSLNIPLRLEFKTLYEYIKSSSNYPRIIEAENGKIFIVFAPPTESTIAKRQDMNELPNSTWLIDVSSFGYMSQNHQLVAIPRKLRYEKKLLLQLISLIRR